MFTDIYSILLLLFLIIILFKYDLKILIIICVFFYILYTYINKSNKISLLKDIDDNNNTYELLNNISEYKNNNLLEYEYGMHYWNIFTNTYSNMKSNNDYDKCKNYLYKSIEHFKSLSLSSNDKNMLLNINKMFVEGSNLLNMKAKSLNKDWYSNPNVTKKEIIINSPLPYNVSFK